MIDQFEKKNKAIVAVRYEIGAWIGSPEEFISEVEQLIQQYVPVEYQSSAIFEIDTDNSKSSPMIKIFYHRLETELEQQTRLKNETEQQLKINAYNVKELNKFCQKTGCQLKDGYE
jgi:hypothetical protein